MPESSSRLLIIGTCLGVMACAAEPYETSETSEHWHEITTSPAPAPTCTGPGVAGADTDQQVIFEHSGWERTPAWPGDYFPNLTTAADVVKACETKDLAGSPVRFGGHSSQVLSLLGCDHTATPATINQGVVDCLTKLKPSHIILDGCMLANAPKNACTWALANATGIPVIAADSCVATCGDTYAALSLSDGETGKWWAFHPTKQPEPKTEPTSASPHVEKIDAPLTLESPSL